MLLFHNNSLEKVCVLGLEKEIGIHRGIEPNVVPSHIHNIQLKLQWLSSSSINAGLARFTGCQAGRAGKQKAFPPEF